MTSEVPQRKPRLCMVGYHETPRSLPPQFHEARSLAEAGFEVESICFATKPESPLVEEHAPGFVTRRFRFHTRKVFQAVFGRGTENRAVAAVQYVLSYAEYLLRALVRALGTRADVYEGHDLPALLPALLAAKLRGKPVVYRAHELWPETHAKVRFARFWRWLDARLVPRCDEVVTPEENRSRIYERELGARRPPLTIRNCPPYQAPVESDRLRAELERRGRRASTIVLYQGLIDSMRCIEEIVEATRSFDEGAVLFVVGSGFGRWADPAAALAGHGRIVVLPRVPYPELAGITASADLGVLLYRNDCRNNYYCAPNKVFEYMMQGLPVIAPRYPGMVPLVEGEGIGLCVNPESPTEIAGAVNRIARSPELRAAMKERGLRLSRDRYNWEQVSRPLLERHRSLAGCPLGLAAGA